MLDANTAARHSYEHRLDKVHAAHEILREQGIQEAFGYESQIKDLIESAKAADEGIYEAISERLQRETPTFDCMLDELTYETCPREINSFLEQYSLIYADVGVAA